MGYDAAFDKLKDECGVFGIWALGGDLEAANFTYLGLHALQHRGQESAGIVATDGKTLHVHRGMGLVADIFTAEILATLKGGAAIGHVRYSTAGAEPSSRTPSPSPSSTPAARLAVAHNGNLVNADQLRNELEAAGSIFQTTSDTEVIVHLMARARTSTARGRGSTCWPRFARPSGRCRGPTAWCSSPRRRSSGSATPWASGRSSSGG